MDIFSIFAQATPTEGTQFTQWVTTLGVGGVLAWGMFYVYRKDMAAHVTAWKGQSEALLAVVSENVKAITALGVLVEVMRGELSDAQARRGIIERRDPDAPPPTPSNPATPGHSPIIDKIVKG